MIRQFSTSLGRLYRIRAITSTPAVTRTQFLPTGHRCGYSVVTTYDFKHCHQQIRTARHGRNIRRELSHPADVLDSDVKANGVPVSITTTRAADHSNLLQPKGEIKAACGDVSTTDNEQDIDFMEQEEMFVEAHESFEHTKKEWGGPRRGGRLPEPTRFGDWERNGRCSDF